MAQTPNNDEEHQTILPIKATGKTDPNYEKNLAISKRYIPYVRKEQPIKNEIYYQNLIDKLKEDIAKREETENQNDVISSSKILKLKDELLLAEENLEKFISEN